MDLIAGQLRKNGRKVALQNQAFLILEQLVRRAKEPVLIKDLHRHLLSEGHNTYDSKHALHNAIYRIRIALGDSKRRPRYLESVPGKGYRFIKEVHIVHDAQSQTEDSFCSKVSDIRREFWKTENLQRLRQLYHDLIELLNQYQESPNRSEASCLLESIQKELSRVNSMKHDISLETAARVLEDPHALTVATSSDHASQIWNTLGRVLQDRKVRPEAVILLVTHESVFDEVTGNKQWIVSARKATKTERAAYDET
jgi:DNA-binding winged helix-turn-helix (wHTH) protein/uncharacterized DUF497 family protein